MKKWEIKPNKILVTSDYEQFNRLVGNRAVLTQRVNNITRSINNVGYIPAPIIVNEKLEVIDGQGRLEACKNINIPVNYIIIPGLSKRECISMNINQVNWHTIDYIKSYAETGSVPYIYVSDCLDIYKTAFLTNSTLKIVMYALTGKVEISHQSIKNGELDCTKDDYDKAIGLLDYAKKFAEYISGLAGDTYFYYMAIMFCAQCPKINNQKLLDKVTLYSIKLRPVATMHEALEQLENIYNYRSKGKNVYIKTIYREAMEGKYKWYNAKYGDKY